MCKLQILEHSVHLENWSVLVLAVMVLLSLAGLRLGEAEGDGFSGSLD